MSDFHELFIIDGTDESTRAAVNSSNELKIRDDDAITVLSNIQSNQTNATQFTKITDGSQVLDITTSNEAKTYSRITDGTDDVPVIANADFTTNLDGENGLVVSACLYGRVDNDTMVPLKVDGSTQDFQIVEHEHAEIHGGDHYFYEDCTTLNAAGTIDLAMQIPDVAKETHLVFEVVSQGQITVQFYEGSTITWDGTALTSYNNDRNSSNTSNWTEFEEDPTVTVVGTKLLEVTLGSSTNPNRGIPGGGDRNRELILKRNTNYLMRITSGVNSNIICYQWEWYEHTAKN